MAPDELVAVEHLREAPVAVLQLSGGDVFLEVAVVPLVDVDHVWEPIAQLHDAAVGGRPVGVAQGLSQLEAFDAWSRATLGLEGYLRAVSPVAAANVLDSATDYAQFAQQLNGLDSVYLSALASAGRDADLTASSLDRAGGLIDDLGMPQMPGGGASQSLITNAGTGSTATVNHESLSQQIADAHGNPYTILDVLAREGVGAAAAGARSLVPGSGKYVQVAGNVVTTTGEAAAWGAATGAAIGGLAGGPAGAAAGGVIGGVIGGIVGFFGSLISGISSLFSSDAAKGDKVPVSPPAPVTDSGGHTTDVGAQGQTAQGRPIGSSGSPPNPPSSSPGPQATQVHCPRGDDDSLGLDLPGWRTGFDLLAAVQPSGPGFDALFTESAALMLPPPSELSLSADVTARGLWGDLLATRPGGTRLGPGIRGPATVDLGRLIAIGEVEVRARLARALVEHADPQATLADAVAMLIDGRARRAAQ
ncbi:MAG TPA: hypothetical protein VGH43_03290 [Jatrophihabitans sp.]|jgi:hypothetical protein